MYLLGLYKWCSFRVRQKVINMFCCNKFWKSFWRLLFKSKVNYFFSFVFQIFFFWLCSCVSFWNSSFYFNFSVLWQETSKNANVSISNSYFTWKLKQLCRQIFCLLFLKDLSVLHLASSKSKKNGSIVLKISMVKLD